MDRHEAPELDGVHVDAGTGMPLHQQISNCVKGRIAAGALPAGARLPSSRSLASQLSVSRATVELAYSVLAAEGYVSRRSAAGTRVQPVPPRRADPPRASLPVVMPGLASQPAQPPRLFQMGLPALDVFPRKLWSRLAARHARSLSLSKMVYQETGGFAPLRQAIANHLAIGRGLACGVAQVFITGGFLGALSVIGRTLLAPGEQVWIEDPGFPPARHALALAGGDLVPVPVDRFGMDVCAGIALAPQARLALVTPAVQFPLGCALSADRRSQLLSWAAEAGAWVIEDSYDSEFDAGGRTLPRRQPEVAADRTLHVGSFSNVLFPGLRLGYLVVPPSLVADFERTSTLLPLQQSLLDQMVVSDFIVEGHYARHLARMRRLYAERRGALSEALNDVLGDSGHAEAGAGLHLLLRLHPQLDDAACAALAAAQGLAVNALSAMALRSRNGPGLLLGFANIAPEAARDAAGRLKAVLDMAGARA